MKHATLISLAALTLLAACTQPTEDCCVPANRAMQEAIDQTRAQAAQAAADARAARDEAARAALAAKTASEAAKTASEKADRIFRQGQNK